MIRLSVLVLDIIISLHSHALQLIKPRCGFAAEFCRYEHRELTFT
jgi:hypothetical protein